MRLLFTLILAILSTSAMAQPMNITCKYEYETLTSYDEVYDSFTTSGEDRGDKILFNHTQKNIPSYFFIEGKHGAYWHHNSSFTFTAIYDKKTQSLNYSFQFNNYVRSYNDFSTVFQQTRHLEMANQFAEDEFDFDYDDGVIINEKINHEPWVNERHVQLDSCNFHVI